MAVLAQPVLAAEYAWVAHTRHPVTGAAALTLGKLDDAQHSTNADASQMAVLAQPVEAAAHKKSVTGAYMETIRVQLQVLVAESLQLSARQASATGAQRNFGACASAMPVRHCADQLLAGLQVLIALF